MIELITGTPGAGKTLRAMWLLEQPEYQGRTVYSNIKGANHEPLPENADWRQTPQGSVVIYDEAQEHFPATGRAGNSQDPRVSALETHRHTGHDLIFVTQRYALIHHHIRALVGRHTHLVRRTKGVSIAFVNGETFEPKDRGKIGSIAEEVWKHPKNLFDAYVSSSLHTAAQNTYRWPLKLKILAVVLVLLLGLVGWLGTKAVSGIGNPGGGDETSTIPENWVKVSEPSVAEAAPEEDLPLWQREGKGGLGGCMASGTECRCWDRTGLPIELEERECRETISKPLHRQVQFGSTRGREGAPAPRPASAF